MNNPNEIDEISSLLKQEIQDFQPAAKVTDAGRVLSVGDGIVHVQGLDDVMSNELLRFENGTSGIAMNLEETTTGVVLLGPETGINEGSFVMRTQSIAQVSVGDNMLGRVVNALGQPIDSEGKIMVFSTRSIERIAPGVIARSPVNRPLETGIKAIDTMVPIGKGQRQLIIGDRQTGKTALTIDTIINQKGKNVNCIYVAIGQKTSTLANIVSVLKEHNAMSYTTIVAAGAAEPIALQYLAPYAGCAIGEEWVENGKDVLIVFDDLSKHAVAYRTMSLLLHRPPGREAYPGDVFYLHSRLLERAGNFSKEYGGGSMTALPIVETLGGAMTAYIPTNVISITDGQVYLESDAFNAGIRPAVNPGLSVSRVGGSAQTKAMKMVAAPIRTQLAQFRDLEAFSQFSSSLDRDTLNSLEHGKRIVEILKQPQYKPMAIAHQVVILYAASNQLLADVDVEDILDLEQHLIEFMKTWNNDLLILIEEDNFTDEIRETLHKIIVGFVKSYVGK